MDSACHDSSVTCLIAAMMSYRLSLAVFHSLMLSVPVRNHILAGTCPFLRSCAHLPDSGLAKALTDGSGSRHSTLKGVTRLLLIYLHLAIISCSDSSLRDCRGITGQNRAPISPFWPPEGSWNLGPVYSKLFLMVPPLRISGREAPFSTQGRYGRLLKVLLS